MKKNVGDVRESHGISKPSENQGSANPASLK